MYITHAISYGNAWETLINDYPKVFEEVEKTIENITFETLTTYEQQKKSRVSTFSPRRLWRFNMREHHWLMISQTSNAAAINLSLLGFLKNKISLNFLNDAETLNRWLYTITPLAISNGNIEIPIVITMVREAHDFINENINSQGVLNSNVFDNFFLDIHRISPLAHQHPFLVLGIDFKKQDIETIEIESQQEIKQKEVFINRSIEFPPEYHQAGLGILSYFNTFIREKYPEQNAKVKIEQNGLKVRLVIESKDGSKEIIEKALHEYQLVVTGQASPDEFYDSPIRVLELKNQLRVFQFQVEAQRDVIALQNGQIMDLKEIAHAALSKPMPDIRIVNQLSNTQNNSINLKNEVNQTYEQLDRLIDLSDNTDMKSRLRDLQNALDQIKNNDNPEDVKDSGAMKKLTKFLNEANEAGTEAKGLVEKGGEALELIKKLGRGYNSIAEWCGLPNIPSVFVKE